MEIAVDRFDLVGPLAARAHVRNRTLNDELRVREAARRSAGPWLLVCECGRPDCAETVEVTDDEYAAVRSDAKLYVVAPGHESPGLTRLVASVGRRFALVELCFAAD